MTVGGAAEVNLELDIGPSSPGLKLHEEESKYIKAKSIEAKLKFTEAKSS